MIEWGEDAESIELTLRIANLFWYALNEIRFHEWR